MHVCGKGLIDFEASFEGSQTASDDFTIGLLERHVVGVPVGKVCFSQLMIFEGFGMFFQPCHSWVYTRRFPASRRSSDESWLGWERHDRSYVAAVFFFGSKMRASWIEGSCNTENMAFEFTYRMNELNSNYYSGEQPWYDRLLTP